MSWLFPSGLKCLICSNEIVSDKKINLCNKCLAHLPKVESSHCLKCGEPVTIDSKYCVHCKKEMPAFVKCVSPFLFEGDVIKLVHGLKYSNKQYYAKTMSALLLSCVLEQNINFDIVIPVPLSQTRLRERGFNQSQALCSEFARCGFAVCDSVVVRSKNTSTQTNLTKAERKLNVENAFSVVDKNVLKNKTVLVVDDVYTTGATLNSITQTLLKAGAKQVYGATFAHTVIKN